MGGQSIFSIGSGDWLAAREGSPLATGVLRKALAASSTSRDRALRSWALALALRNQKSLPEALETADVLGRESPDSRSFSTLRLGVLGEMRRWADVSREAGARPANHPDDGYALHIAATAPSSAGDFDAADAFLRKEAAAPGSEAIALNSLVWNALCRGRVADDAIAAAQRAADLSRQQNAAVLNTLAALFAAAAKTSEARQILGKMILRKDQDELEAADWLVVALIAESDGLQPAALRAYARIASAPAELPTSVSAVARKREAALKEPARR